MTEIIWVRPCGAMAPLQIDYTPYGCSRVVVVRGTRGILLGEPHFAFS
jgi:hypothetical protein